MNAAPVTLEGRFVKLVPANVTHASDLARVADEETFQYIVTGAPSSYGKDGLEGYIQRLLEQPTVLPFTVFDQLTNRAVGMTCYLDIRSAHRALEVGMTWYGRDYRGTQVNPESKLLILGHAFEAMNAVRVQLKTDARNLQSQRAIEKLGATKEGVLRNHMTFASGYVRDTVMYSILPGEWPAVKAGLIARLR